MEEFFHQLTNGLAVGGIYALIALGYTMVYGVLRLINFAHGDLFTLGSYLGLTLLFSLGLQGKMSGILVGGALIVMSMGLVAVVGYLLERVAYRPLRGSNRLAAVVSALGASIFFSNASSACLRANPPAYPVSEPFVPITRWQGIRKGIGLTRLAAPTARLADGLPIAWAIWR